MVIQTSHIVKESLFMPSKLKIKIIENGPILISKFKKLKYGKETLPTKEKALLCRCGESKKQPFCDGKHKASNFKGECSCKVPEKIRIWEGKNIITYFNKDLCMHAGYCAPLGELRLAEHFNNDVNAAKEIARVITECPAGALSYEMKDGSTPVEFESSDVVEIMKNGEIRIWCEADGIETVGKQPKNRITLCRCGKSKIKPFCDASHKKQDLIH